MDQLINPEHLINDLLDQVRQLTLQNSVLRVSNNQLISRVNELESGKELIGGTKKANQS